ncbi:kinase [Kitasatospora sp. NPDC004745]|uniref:GHMP family kinase ATP-binding protein n=1 Tax=unclassified Kitasatospora TaxID=2633591 RepID=UPI0034019A87
MTRADAAAGTATAAVLHGTGSAPGTFGELLQGVTAEERLDFLVTLPIDAGATATFTAEPGAGTVTVHPPHKHRAARLVRLMLDAYGFAGGGRLRLSGGLPEGRGLASSSADLVATARAVGEALGVPVGPAVIEDFLRRIEPTDGVMYDGVVSFYHRQVRLRELLGPLSPMVIVGVEEGGAIDTLGFNRRPKPFTRAHRLEYDELLERVSEAVRTDDLPTVGRVATRSALLNEHLQPKRLLHRMIGLSEEFDALGVAVAHSGTALGVLVAESDPECARKVAELRTRAAALAGHTTLYRSWRGPGR